MRIAIIGNLPGPISIDGPGGSEVFVYNLTNHLLQKYPDLKLFASSDSSFPKNTYPFFPSSEISGNKDIEKSFLDKKIVAYKLALFSAVVKEANNNQFDIIHNNVYETFLFFPFSNLVKQPVIHTVHNVLFDNSEIGLYAERILPKKDTLIFVSKNSANRSKGNYRKNFIYNGIDIQKFNFDPNWDESLVWMSRAVPKKGLKTAIETSLKTNRKFKIITKVSSQEEQNFLDSTMIQSKNLSLFTNPTQEERVKLLQFSKTFIFPISWEEPFGLVMIEAMACGTPVVAYAKGSVPEVVKDGETGFIVNSSTDDVRGDWIVKKTGMEGFCEAVERIYSMPEEQYKQMRRNCRTHVEKNFTVERMVDQYEEIYKQILENK